GNIVATVTAANLKALIQRLREGFMSLGVKFALKQVNNVPFPDFEIQLIEYSDIPNSGSFKLTYDSTDTVTLNHNVTAIDIQNALRAIPDLETVSVTGNSTDGFSVNFVGVPGDIDMLQSKDVTLEVLHDITQTLTFSAVPASGDFVLDFDGNLTNAIDWDASDADVQTILRDV